MGAARCRLGDAGVHGGRGSWEDDLRDIRGTYLDSGGDFLVGLADGELVGMGGLLRRSAGEGESRGCGSIRTFSGAGSVA